MAKDIHCTVATHVTESNVKVFILEPMVGRSFNRSLSYVINRLRLNKTFMV